MVYVCLSTGADGKGFEVEDYLKDNYGKTDASGPPEPKAPSIVNAAELGFPMAASSKL